jgi:hypothetical protein
MRVWSQKATLGAGLSHILDAGDEVSSDCYDHVHSTGFGPRATVSMLSGRGTVAATAQDDSASVRAVESRGGKAATFPMVSWKWAPP